MIRKPIITVLGHVDSGKTSFLDRIRGTAVISQEAGAITQHIGATEVPIDAIQKIAGGLIQRYGFDLKIPGLLFIDTPGHEAFTNLRKRGSSIADLAVLIVDVNQGIEKQTSEAIEILKAFKVPFVVGLTKIDKMHYWTSREGTITENLKNQTGKAVEELDEKIYGLVGKFHEKGFVTERFDRVKDLTKEIPIVPVCNKTGEGIPEILMFLAGLSQKYLEEKLKVHVSGAGKGTILEVKEEKGLGKTIDVILYDGMIKVGEEIVLGGKFSVIRTKVRALLKPKALDEIRAPQEKFENAKEVHAASGIKIAAPNLDNALAGSPVMVAESMEQEKEIEEIIQEIRIESDVIGPILRADTLGSMEAIAGMLEAQGIKLRKADVGEVTRKDVMEAKTIKAKDKLKGVIFAFNTKVMPEAMEEAQKEDVKVFADNVIYKLIEDYEEWAKEEREAEKKERLASLFFPAKIKVLPNNVFRHSKPAIVGVRVLEGKIVDELKLMNKGKVIGKIQAIQSKGENLKEAKKGEEVAISISGGTVGRNLMEGDQLISFIPKNQLERWSTETDSLSEEEKALLEEIKKIEEKQEEVNQ